MRIITEADINGVLTYPSLIEHLRHTFKSSSDICVPLRQHHTIETSSGENGMCLIMPAWTNKSSTGYIGVKILNLFPSNRNRALPPSYGFYLLSDSVTGRPLAMLDSAALTRWRTACASALAAVYLAVQTAQDLLMVGAGTLAPHLIKAHLSVRPSLHRVLIWNRSPAGARSLAEALIAERKASSDGNVSFEAVENLEHAVMQADIISCATASDAPIVKGQWLKAGAHVDLVGAYKPSMRETDNDAVHRARVYVDTVEGALAEGGDLIVPLTSGVITRTHILGDLAQLCQGQVHGRRSTDEVTLFKSVGFALEDLAGAALVYEALERSN